MPTRRVLLAGGLAAATLGAGGYAAVRWSAGRGAYEAAAASLREPLPADPSRDALVRYATLAANGHNTQPWRFSVGRGGILIRPDPSRRTPVVDPDDHHLFASLGCAAENLSLAARAVGMSGEVSASSEGVRVELAPGAPEAGSLFAAIPVRQCTRTDYDGSALEPELVEGLRAEAAVHRTEAIWLSERREVAAVLDLVLAGVAAQMADPAFRTELKAWLRFSPERAARLRDGLYGAASGAPPIPEWLGRSVFDAVFTAESESDRYAQQVRSSSGVMVLAGPRDSAEGWIEAGRALQRLSLRATAEGLRVAHLNQAVEHPAARAELQRLLGLGDRRPDMVLRIGRGPAAPYSLRRPVEAVLA